MIQQSIKIKPLSVNLAWQGKRFKTQAYKAFEAEMTAKMKPFKKPISHMIRVDLFFGFSSPLADIDNPVKMTLDILQKKYGFNDKNIYELNVRKCIVKKREEFIDFGIYPLLPFER